MHTKRSRLSTALFMSALLAGAFTTEGVRSARADTRLLPGATSCYADREIDPRWGSTWLEDARMQVTRSAAGVEVTGLSMLGLRCRVPTFRPHTSIHSITVDVTETDDNDSSYAKACANNATGTDYDCSATKTLIPSYNALHITPPGAWGWSSRFPMVTAVLYPGAVLTGVRYHAEGGLPPLPGGEYQAETRDHGSAGLAPVKTVQLP